MKPLFILLLKTLIYTAIIGVGEWFFVRTINPDVTAATWVTLGCGVGFFTYGLLHLDPRGE